MDRVDAANRLQTLQIYRKKEVIPAEVRIKRLVDELKSVKKYSHVVEVIKAPFEHDESEREGFEAPKLRKIRHQNLVMGIEKLLTNLEQDYRELIDEMRELDRKLIKNDHDLERSDREAETNVGKVRHVEQVKERIVNQFKELCLEKEDIDETSKVKIQALEKELYESKRKIDELEYSLMRMK